MNCFKLKIRYSAFLLFNAVAMNCSYYYEIFKNFVYYAIGPLINQSCSNGRPCILSLSIIIFDNDVAINRLVKQGHTVIGIEHVQKAIEDFSKENNVSFVKTIVDGYGHCYTVTYFDIK